MKNQLAKALVDSLKPLAESLNISHEELDQESQYWFWNSRSNLRLSSAGHYFLKERLGLGCYCCRLDQPLTNRQLIKLINYCKGPFFIKNSSEIWLYSELDSVFLVLNNNNIDGL